MTGDCALIEARGLCKRYGAGATAFVALRALAGDPLLVLADEPTSNFDSDTGGVILELFREINRQGTAFVMVTHNRELAADCGRTLHLRDGRLAPGERGA